MGLSAQHHIFNRRQGVDQHKVLVHHANAVCNRVMCAGDHHGLTIDDNLAAISPAHAIKHRHQRAFAGTVFTHNAVHSAAAHAQIHIDVGLRRAKALANTRHMHCKPSG